MRAIQCWFGHTWPEVWTKYGNRSSIDYDGLWWEVFEKVCYTCGARKTYAGPLRYKTDGSIADANWISK